jgi:hypothetical protein
VSRTHAQYRVAEGRRDARLIQDCALADSFLARRHECCDFFNNLLDERLLVGDVIGEVQFHSGLKVDDGREGHWSPPLVQLPPSTPHRPAAILKLARHVQRRQPVDRVVEDLAALRVIERPVAPGPRQ